MGNVQLCLCLAGTSWLPWLALCFVFSHSVCTPMYLHEMLTQPSNLVVLGNQLILVDQGPTAALAATPPPRTSRPGNRFIFHDGGMVAIVILPTPNRTPAGPLVIRHAERLYFGRSHLSPLAVVLQMNVAVEEHLSEKPAGRHHYDCRPMVLHFPLFTARAFTHLCIPCRPPVLMGSGLPCSESLTLPVMIPLPPHSTPLPHPPPPLGSALRITSALLPLHIEGWNGCHHASLVFLLASRVQLAPIFKAQSFGRRRLVTVDSHFLLSISACYPGVVSARFSPWCVVGPLDFGYVEPRGTKTQG